MKNSLRPPLVSHVESVKEVSEGRGRLVDEVFIEQDENDSVTEGENTDEIDLEIARSVRKNNSAKTIEKELFPHIVTGSVDYVEEAVTVTPLGRWNRLLLGRESGIEVSMQQMTVTPDRAKERWSRDR